MRRTCAAVTKQSEFEGRGIWLFLFVLPTRESFASQFAELKIKITEIRRSSEDFSLELLWFDFRWCRNLNEFLRRRSFSSLSLYRKLFGRTSPTVRYFGHFHIRHRPRRPSILCTGREGRNERTQKRNRSYLFAEKFDDFLDQFFRIRRSCKSIFRGVLRAFEEAFRHRSRSDEWNSSCVLDVYYHS